MEEIVFYLLVSLAGLAAGFFDSLVGGGGLLSVPSLVLLGINPQMAIATERFGSIGQAIAATIKFWKAKKIVWKYVSPLCILSLVGAVIGAYLLLYTTSYINEKIFGNIMGVLMLILLPVVFLKKDLGIKHRETNKKNNAVGYLIFFLIAIFAGFYGQGTGPMVFYTLIFFLGLTMLESIGTSVVGWLLLTISSSLIFAFKGLIYYKIGLVLFVSMSVGSYLGASTAVRSGDLWIKRLFIVLVVIMGVKLLFFNSP